jgi:hypothetical protein
MKKIAVLLPDLPQKTFIKPLDENLSFLASQGCHIDYIDPFDYHEDVENITFYANWKARLNKMEPDYDAFFGFSFGGVILQQCFDLFEHGEKPIVLFSTPTKADVFLTEKLSHVIAQCQKGLLYDALNDLYAWVFAPYKLEHTNYPIDDEAEALERMITGLSRVLETDSTEVMQKTNARFIHFIGEHSNLVTRKNIIMPASGLLLTVPNAGMRVLKDNPNFCQSIILDYVL